MASTAPTESNHMTGLDLILINPGGRDRVYQELGHEFTAVEPPLWCGLLATYARNRGISVRIIDSDAERIDPEAVGAQVDEADPVLVAVVVYGHQPSASTQMMPNAGDICRQIKSRNPDRKIVMVGGHVAALPERTLEEEAIDYACTGEGPVTMVELVGALRDGDAAAVTAVPGLAFLQGDEILKTPGAPLISDLDADLPGSAWDLLPMDKYRAHNWQCFGDLGSRTPYASIYTTLGCPYKCVFCCINAPFGKNGYRMRSPESVVAEIDHLYTTYGVRTIKIVDEMFVLNEKHVTGICELLAQRDYDLNIWAYARVDTVKPHMLALLRKAGIRWLALGIESGSEHVRDGAQKSFKASDIVEIVDSIQKAGINVIGNFIFGLPDDTMETMQATLDLAKQLNCEFANFYSAMAYPGSPLYELAVEIGWALPESWSGFSQHSHDTTPLPTDHVSAADVLGFRDEAFHDYFTSRRYLDMVSQRFGVTTRAHVEQMTRHRLDRKLLETPSTRDAEFRNDPAVA